MSKREVPGLMIKTLGDKLRVCRKTWTLKEVADRAEMSEEFHESENNGCFTWVE